MPLFAFSQVKTVDEYLTRRQKVLSMMDTTMALVMKSINNPPLVNEYVQDHNFLYLTGINEPMNILLISPKGFKLGDKIKNTIVFNSSPKTLNYLILGKNDTIIKYSQFKDIFRKLLPSIKKLYYSVPDLIVVNDWINDNAYFTESKMKRDLKEKFPNLSLESAEFFVGKLRSIKSTLEIENIRKASNITADGLINAMKIAKPGMFEYELQATLEYEFTNQGALQKGFPSIIGSGPNSLILHYSDNNRQTKDGELVVMDVGAKVNGYSSDITRTIPISGKFSEAQKEIYTIILNVQKEAISMVKSGVNINDIEKYARDAFKKVGYQKYFIHGLSHPVGLDVHDISVDEVLKPGMVITIEPGLYFPLDDKNIPEKYRGIGIRIEDTILVTNDGYEILTSRVPKEISEVEKSMKKKN